MRGIVVIDRKFVILMFISLTANYVKYSETGLIVLNYFINHILINIALSTAINDRNDQSLKAQRQNASQTDSQYHPNHDDVSKISHLI